MPMILRFHEELNDFLPKNHKGVTIEHWLHGRRSVKDLLESLGVPHTEIGRILVNGQRVEFSHIVGPNDQIEVYPSAPEPSLKSFVLDLHLRKLARVLRMLGIDVVHDPSLDDNDLIDHAQREDRVLLTRDLGILKTGRLKHGYFIRNTDPMLQAQEVIKRFALHNQIKALTRCLECNGILRAIEATKVRAFVPDGVYARKVAFHECDRCHRIYWKGSHFDRMQETINALISRLQRP